MNYYVMCNKLCFNLYILELWLEVLNGVVIKSESTTEILKDANSLVTLDENNPQVQEILNQTLYKMKIM